MDISKLEDKRQSRYSVEVVKRIFDKLEEKIKSNVAMLHDAVSKDNKEFLESTQYSLLLSTIDRARKEDWILDKNSSSIQYYGIGNIAAVTNGDIDVNFYLILKALKTNNNLVLFNSEKTHEVISKIIKLVNEVCSAEHYITYIDSYQYSDYKDLLKYSEKFELYMFVNTFDMYKKYLEKADYKNAIYSSYGAMSLYMDDKNLKQELLKMDEYVFNKNIDLDLIKEVSVEEAVERINANVDNYAAVIFTKDTKKAYYFIEHVRARQVFVNKNPGTNYIFEIDDAAVVKQKSIFI